MLQPITDKKGWYMLWREDKERNSISVVGRNTHVVVLPSSGDSGGAHDRFGILHSVVEYGHWINHN